MLGDVYSRAKQFSKNEDDKNHWADLAGDCLPAHRDELSAFQAGARCQSPLDVQWECPCRHPIRARWRR
jgi:hypothetical protein